MGIRTKLFLVGLLFLTIPFMGYRFVKDMRSLIQKGLESALLLEARAIATVLNERAELFDPTTGIPSNPENRWHIYAQPVFNKIKIDGKIDDWRGLIQSARFFGSKNLLSETAPESDKDLSFWHVLAYDDAYIYSLFQVQDDILKLRTAGQALNASDVLQVYLMAEYPKIDRFLLNANKPGKMQIHKMQDDWRQSLEGEKPDKFLAWLRPSAEGYNIELRMPIEMVIKAGFIGFAISDVDFVSGVGDVAPVIVSSMDPERVTDLNKILLRSPQIEKILAGLDKPNGRVWVVDQYHRVRALTGSVQNLKQSRKDRRDLIEKFLDYLIADEVRDFKDLPESTTLLTNQAITSALKNQPTNFVRDSLDTRARIVGAAYPIEIDNKITGAVIVEQSTNEILASQNNALVSVVKIIALIVIIAIISLLWFATRLTFRINRLHTETANAIDDKGRFKPGAKISGGRKKDELGALTANFKQIMQKLHQHTAYLERMPRTLRHEILNPLNVLNTSVENLESELDNPKKAQKYITSTKNGIRRLGSILHGLTEAATLEQALEPDYKEVFDLVALCREYMKNYKLTHPDKEFIIELSPDVVEVFGWPEAIAQLLDKIVDNAVDFSKEQTPVVITIKTLAHRQVCIYISNQGEHIAEDIQDSIFESMVSRRLDKQSSRPHLGIGLYVARVIVETHNGTISTRNTLNPQGVEFAICLPTHSKASVLG